jgi:hypothetical protein
MTRKFKPFSKMEKKVLDENGWIMMSVAVSTGYRV